MDSARYKHNIRLLERYINLEKYGYKHKTVNHSKEFVNEEGDNTNKIEGHWRQLNWVFLNDAKQLYKP